MKKLFKTVIIWILLIMYFNIAYAGKPELKLPFVGIWYLSRGYNTAGTHLGDDKYALDFTLPECDAWGKPILAAAAGRVETIPEAESKGYGNCVLIYHGDEYVTRYGHLESFSVVDNEWVHQGQEIGKCGDTGYCEGAACPSHPGTHLHFAMYYNGSAYKPEPIDSNTNLKAGKWYTSTNGKFYNDHRDFDNYCKIFSPDPKVERFRGNDGKIVVNMSPSDGRIWYYKEMCTLGYYDVFNIWSGEGGYYPTNPIDPLPSPPPSDPPDPTSDIAIRDLKLRKWDSGDWVHEKEITLAAGEEYAITLKSEIENKGSKDQDDIDVDFCFVKDKKDFDVDDDRMRLTDEDEDIESGDTDESRSNKVTISLDNDLKQIDIESDEGKFDLDVTEENFEDGFIKLYFYVDAETDDGEDQDVSSESNSDEYAKLVVKIKFPEVETKPASNTVQTVIRTLLLD